MSVILELGPGETFVFDTPGGTTTNNLPEGLKDLELGIGQGRPIENIYSLNFGCNGTYILAARTEKGALIRRNNLPPQLESWLIDPVTHMCKRDIATLSVEFGPNNSFYARDKDSYRWHNLPDALEEAIQQRLCPAGWMARPDFVVLGADGAFIYSNDRGGCSHALGNYPKLQEFVIGVQKTNVGGFSGFGLVQWVSMSLYRAGQFIALHNSGQCVAEVSPDATHALGSMAGTFPIRNFAQQHPQQRAVSQPIMHQPSPPPMYSVSPPPMTHNALPVRKPVGSAPAQPQTLRPQAPHLVSSPVPQTRPPRPAVQSQASAPAVPQVPSANRPTSMQPPAQSTIRPTSMQVPPQSARPNTENRTSMNLQALGRIANVFSHSQQQQNNNANHSNSNYNVNYSSNTNTNANVNNSGTTYVVTDGSTATPTYAPTYVVDGNNSTIVNDTNVYNTTVDSTNVYNTNVDSSNIYNTTVDNTSVYNTTVDSTNVYNSTVDTTNTYDVAVNNTNVYDTTVNNTNVYDTTVANTNIYDTTVTDNTTYNTAVADSNTYNLADNSEVSAISANDTVVSAETISGDVSTAVDSSGGFWSGLFAGGSGGDVATGGGWGGDCSGLI